MSKIWIQANYQDRFFFFPSPWMSNIGCAYNTFQTHTQRKLYKINIFLRNQGNKYCNSSILKNWTTLSHKSFQKLMKPN